jgi:lipoate-protein ligase A
VEQKDAVSKDELQKSLLKLKEELMQYVDARIANISLPKVEITPEFSKEAERAILQKVRDLLQEYELRIRELIQSRRR